LPAWYCVAHTENGESGQPRVEIAAEFTRADALLDDILEDSFQTAKRRAIEGFETQYLSQLLSETSGNVSEAARRSGMKRSAFQRLMAKYRLQTLEFRK